MSLPPQNNGPVRRWTIGWARQMARRMAEDQDYRRSIGIRGLRLIRTGRIDPMSKLSAPRDVLALFKTLQVGLPEGLDNTFVREPPYSSWLAVNRTTPRSEAELSTELARHEGRLPKISLITPVYNTPEPLLRALVDSVAAQVHKDWELLLIDDGSHAPHIRPLLTQLSAEEPRIRAHFREMNGGISRATQTGAMLADGAVLAFLDHDDLITPDCVAELAIAYCDHPEADVVYSDNDKIDMEGNRFAPQFKPNWSPTLLLSHMYLCHVFSIRRSLYLELGGFLPEYDGSQDFEFALRVAEKARKIIHIPRILYHWRTAPGSTALSGDAKPESLDAGRRAVAAALERRGTRAQAEQPSWASAIKIGHYALRFPDSGPSVSVIVTPTADTTSTKRCRMLLEATAYAPLEIVFAEHQPGETMKFCLNRAAKASNSDMLVFLSSRLEPRDPNWLARMVGHAVAANAGAVGAKLAFADGSVFEAGVVITSDGRALRALSGEDGFAPGPNGYLKTTRECSAVSTLCLLTPRAVFEQLGGFDEERFPGALAGVDYCLRLAGQGRPTLCCAESELQLTANAAMPTATELTAFSRQWRGYRDPFYNPNLSDGAASFTPARRRLPTRTEAPQRVAIVTHSLAKEGAPITLRDLVLGLKATGAIDPVVLSPLTGPLADDYRAAGVEVRLFSPPSTDRGQGAFIEGCETLSELFREWKADTVIANTLQSYYAVFAARSAGLAAILCQHESGPWRSYFDNLPPSVRPFAYAAPPLSYQVTFVADATRNDWNALNVKENFRTIRHAIPKALMEQIVHRWRRDDARRHLGVASQDYVLLVVGTVSERKGQVDLVAALSHLDPQARRDVRVLIVGALNDPGYLSTLKAEVDKLPIELRDRISITGAAPDIAPYYSCADVYVCTSRSESAPRVLLEAMSFSLPIITTPVFGIPEIVAEGASAAFYPPGDAKALAQLAGELFENPSLRVEMGKAGHERLTEQPDFDDMVHDYAALIREAALAS